MYDDEKTLVLENSVINDPPGETALLYKSFGEVPFTLRALGYACRYRGLDMVKALVECGANFNYNIDDFSADPDFVNCRRLLYKYPDDLPAFLFFYINNTNTHRNLWGSYIVNNNGGKLPFLPIGERVCIAEYLCDHARGTGFEAGDLLFHTIITRGIEELYCALKNKGVTLSDKKKKYIISGKIVYSFGMKNNAEIKSLISRLLPELDGKKPRLHNHTWYHIDQRIEDTDMLRFVFENFDLEEIKKLTLVKKIIEFGDITLLEHVIDQGWLLNPKKRDEMIEYSVKNGKTECTASLLDYKNRAFDLAAEREKAEKRLEREFNAAPDSARVLSEFWGFKKRPGGTMIITDYKGNKTRITVPEKIDGIPVTVIGKYAFSPEARVKYKRNRMAITEIILPDTITEIGEYAFYNCKELTRIELPESINRISIGSFAMCFKLTASLHKGSYAEQFCIENKIPFEYKV